MRYSLYALFSFFDQNNIGNLNISADKPVLRDTTGQGDLFATEAVPLREAEYAQQDIAIAAGLYASCGLNLSVLCGPARRLYGLSQSAFDDFVHAWMSELPIEAELVRFGRKAFAAADAATDRGDPDVQAVLEAVSKVRREIDRLRGLLRFSPDTEGVYVARCQPDHFVLPALVEHFTRRFGETPWVIIDEKREICLCRLGAEPAMFCGYGAFSEAGQDEWEGLWRLYHKTISNESRKNPGLQRQFMPQRYWKHLPEL
jgi:probable DNA metabolism protein